MKRERNEQRISESNGLKGDNTVKSPDGWTTGDEPMTSAQSSYLKIL